ncbi:MAG: methyltransferase domain-containing protein, partial [Candidatus Omnitrophota bacterium]
TSIVREVFIPALEKEVNEGKNFAKLRQIYNAIILSYWYKTNFKNSILNKVYSNQHKDKGIDISSKDTTDKIYAQYLETFKKGVCNMMKVEYDPYAKKSISRKYFAGGVKFGAEVSAATTTTGNNLAIYHYVQENGLPKNAYELQVRFDSNITATLNQASQWVSDNTGSVVSSGITMMNMTWQEYGFFQQEEGSLSQGQGRGIAVHHPLEASINNCLCVVFPAKRVMFHFTEASYLVFPNKEEGGRMYSEEERKAKYLEAQFKIFSGEQAIIADNRKTIRGMTTEDIRKVLPHSVIVRDNPGAYRHILLYPDGRVLIVDEKETGLKLTARENYKKSNEYRELWHEGKLGKTYSEKEIADAAATQSGALGEGATPSSASPLEGVVQQAVFASRVAFAKNAQASYADNPLSPSALISKCPLAQADLARRIQKFATNLGEVKIRFHQAFDLFFGDYRHSFLVVSLNNKDYLVDTTFIQFFDSRNQGGMGIPGEIINKIADETKNNWKDLATKLLQDGYIELTDDVADMYGTALRGKLPKKGRFSKEDLLQDSTEKTSYADNELNELMGEVTVAPRLSKQEIDAYTQMAMEASLKGGTISRSTVNPEVQKQFYDKKFGGKHFYQKGNEVVFISVTAVDDALRGAVAEKIIEEVDKLGKKNLRGLSIGEGQGHLAVELAKKGLANIDAIDISGKNIEAAKARMEAAGVHGIRFKEGDAERLDFAKNTFDFVILNESIGGLNPAIALAEAKRVLNPSGRIILTTYNAEKETVEQNPALTHYKSYQIEELEAMLQGFVSVRHEEMESTVGLGVLNFFTATKADEIKTRKISSSVLSSQEAQEFEKSFFASRAMFVRKAKISIDGQEGDVVFDVNASYLRVGGIVMIAKSILDRFSETISKEQQLFIDQKAIVMDGNAKYLNYLVPMLALMIETDLANKVVWDYGAGNGILGLVALRLGAKKVIAVENDAAALERAQVGFEKMLGNKESIAYLKGSAWEKYQPQESQKVFLLEADLNTIFRARNQWHRPIDRKFVGKEDSIVLANIGAFYPEVYDNLIKDSLYNKSQKIVLGGYDREPFMSRADKYSVFEAEKFFKGKKEYFSRKKIYDNGSQGKKFEALVVTKTSSAISEVTLGNKTRVLFSSEAVPGLIAGGEDRFLINAKGKAVIGRDVDSEGYKRFTTSLDTIKENFGERTFDDFYERALQAQKNDPERKFTVVSWGAGEGRELREMEKELKERGIDNVRLIGFANIYFSRWGVGDSQITWILDDGSRFNEYFEDGEIDFMFSSIGLYHVRPLESHFKYMRDIAPKINTDGVIVYDYGVPGTDYDFTKLSDTYSIDPSWSRGIIKLQSKSGATQEDSQKESQAVFPAEGYYAAGSKIIYEYESFVFNGRALYPRETLQPLGPEDSVRVKEENNRLGIEIFKGRMGQEELVASYAAPQAASSGILSSKEAKSFEEAIFKNNKDLNIHKERIVINGQEEELVWDGNTSYLRVGPAVICSRRLTIPEEFKDFAQTKAVLIENDLTFFRYVIPFVASMLETDFRGKVVWDYGAGDGVLGLLALRLGAQRVISIDHDAKEMEKARKAFERQLGSPRGVVYLKEGQWADYKPTDDKKVILLEDDLSQVLESRVSEQENNVDMNFSGTRQVIVLANVGLFYKDIIFDVLVDAIEGRSSKVILGGCEIGGETKDHSTLTMKNILKEGYFELKKDPYPVVEKEWVSPWRTQYQAMSLIKEDERVSSSSLSDAEVNKFEQDIIAKNGLRLQERMIVVNGEERKVSIDDSFGKKICRYLRVGPIVVMTNDLIVSEELNDFKNNSAVVVEGDLSFREHLVPVIAAMLGQDLKGKIIKDYGTGNGALSLVALRLGAKMVVGVEVVESEIQKAKRASELAGYKTTYLTEDQWKDYVASSEDQAIFIHEDLNNVFKNNEILEFNILKGKVALLVSNTGPMYSIGDNVIVDIIRSETPTAIVGGYFEQQESQGHQSVLRTNTYDVKPISFEYKNSVTCLVAKKRASSMIENNAEALGDREARFVKEGEADFSSNPNYKEFVQEGFGGGRGTSLELLEAMSDLADWEGIVVPQDGIGMVVGFGNAPEELEYLKERFGLSVVHGVDFVDSRVKSAADFLTGMGYSMQDFPLHTADMNNMEDVVQDGSVDLVVAINVTMMSWDNIDGFAKEIVRILRPGGKAFIGTAFGASFKNYLEKNGKIFFHSGDRLIFVKGGEKDQEDAIKGGIDFNAQNMNLEATGVDINFVLPQDITAESLRNIEGLVPVIINITPITNFYQVMGLQEKIVGELSLKEEI